jgi:hypothetical protein
MILNPFQVRLKDQNSPAGFREGIVGTVVGLIPTKTEAGVVEVYKVLWFNYDEDNGDTTPNVDAPAPSSHMAQELVGFVDDFDDLDEDETDDTDDLFDDSNTVQTQRSAPTA